MLCARDILAAATAPWPPHIHPASAAQVERVEQVRAWLRKWEVARLKRRARRAHYAMGYILDGMDCGHALAMTISSRYRAAVSQWETSLARLREIAPDFPKEPEQ